MKPSDFKPEIKVKVSSSYTKRKLFVGSIGILIGPECGKQKQVSVQHDDYPHVLTDTFLKACGVPLKWAKKRFCSFPAQYLEIVGDERACVGCLVSKVRQPTPEEVPLDHKCWSCING